METPHSSMCSMHVVPYISSLQLTLLSTIFLKMNLAPSRRTCVAALEAPYQQYVCNKAPNSTIPASHQMLIPTSHFSSNLWRIPGSWCRPGCSSIHTTNGPHQIWRALFSGAPEFNSCASHTVHWHVNAQMFSVHCPCTQTVVEQHKCTRFKSKCPLKYWFFRKMGDNPLETSLSGRVVQQDSW